MKEAGSDPGLFQFVFVFDKRLRIMYTPVVGNHRENYTMTQATRNERPDDLNYSGPFTVEQQGAVLRAVREYNGDLAETRQKIEALGIGITGDDLDYAVQSVWTNTAVIDIDVWHASA